MNRNDFQWPPLGGYSEKDEEWKVSRLSISAPAVLLTQETVSSPYPIAVGSIQGNHIDLVWSRNIDPHSHESSSWQSWEGFEPPQKAGNISVGAADCEANAWPCSDCAMEGKMTLNYLGNVSYAQGQEESVTYGFLLAVKWECPI